MSNDPHTLRKLDRAMTKAWTAVDTVRLVALAEGARLGREQGLREALDAVQTITRTCEARFRIRALMEEKK